MLLDALQQSAPGIALSLLVASILAFCFAKIRQNLRIRKLGGRAPNINPYPFLFGMDVILDAMRMAWKNQNFELWRRRFDGSGHTVEMELFGQRIIITEDPENIKAILASQFSDYGKGKDFHRQWLPFLGNSIFTTDGSEWHSSRQLIRPQFIKDRISDLETFERNITHMMTLIPHDGSAVDIKDLFYRYTLDIATEFLLGNTVNSLGSPRAEFAVAFADLQKFMNDISRVGPAENLFPRGKFNKNLAILNAFVEPYVEQTLQLKPFELKDKTEKNYNFLHALAEFTRDKRMLRDQLVAVLLAARDTTAATLSWTFHELSKKPEVVQKLREEILSSVGPDNNPTYSDLKNMKYLSAIINEILRLYPAVPFNVRTSLKDTYLPRGAGVDGNEPVGVPKDTPIAYSTLTMQRREDIFGPSVNEFDPDRWSKWVPKSWQYIPFNGGPRICIGQQFALTEMGYTIVRLFQEFEAIESRMTKAQWMQTEIVGSPGEGVVLSFRPAKC
ncbi:cytochrome P450 [Morchella snyderi]|nr:cytochrome P450 [Morchella snyderi]